MMFMVKLVIVIADGCRSHDYECAGEASGRDYDCAHAHAHDYKYANDT